MNPEYAPLITKHATNFRLDEDLIISIITIESNWNTWAVRFEPGSTLLNNPSDYASKLNLSLATEENCQHTSFGLGQIIGFLARDLGMADHLVKLCDPDTGLFYMCKNLRRLSDKYGLESDVVASYNMGSPRKTDGGMYLNQKSYVDKIYGVLNGLRALS